MRTEAVQKSLLRALQNERGNQCVRSSPYDPAAGYHTGDVNEHGYSACVALLDYQRLNPGGLSVRYGDLRRLPTRSRSSKECGCSPRSECNGICVRTADGGCVPRSANTRGFVGSPPHPDQKERSSTSVRNRSRTRRTSSLANDPDSQRDIRAGHSLQLRYSLRGNHMWRRPSSKVRLPSRSR